MQIFMNKKRIYTQMITSLQWFSVGYTFSNKQTADKYVISVKAYINFLTLGLI